MNKLIIPTGYMGSGSSALTDLISEFDGCEAPLGSFEYVFLHCPNGVFDLEDKLLVGNNGLRSDEALRSFRTMMQELYSTRFWWPGEYDRNLSHQFMDIVDRYMDALTHCWSKNFWYYQEERGWRAFLPLAFNKVVRTVTGGRIWPAKPLRYQGMTLSLPTSDEFYEASRAFIGEVVEEIVAGIPSDPSGLILDQLLLPHNAWRFDDYFGSEAECFIVERDPRDVFLANKYIWAKRNEQVPWPTDADEFVEYYRRMRHAERPFESARVHRIRFEDLVYRYDETVVGIKDILGIDDGVEQKTFQGFDPKRSINNTQLFLLPEFAEESAIIAQGLAEYLYEFPYERMPNKESIF